MKRSLYYTETKSSKSNTMTAVGITIVVIILGVFLAVYGLSKANGAMQTDIFKDRARHALSRAHKSFSEVSYIKITDDEPSDDVARVHLFRVTNFREGYYKPPMSDAYVKIELSDVQESDDKFVSASDRPD